MNDRYAAFVAHLGSDLRAYEERVADFKDSLSVRINALELSVIALRESVNAPAPAPRSRRK